MTVTVREGVGADRPALLDLWIDAWQAAMPAIDFEARRDWMEQRLDALAVAGATIMVACDDAGIAGFVTADPIRRDLDQLAVAPDRQGHGVARTLIDAAKALSPRGLTLSVNAGNPRAIALYLRMGFVVTGHGANPRSGLPVQTMAWMPEPSRTI